MQSLLSFFQAHVTLANVLLVGGSLIGILTILGNGLKALAPAGSKAAHLADLLLALAIDVQKALGAAQKLFGSSPVVQVAKALLLALGLGLALRAAPARAAEPTTIHVGPSVSLYELRLDGQIGQLTPGLGVQGWLNFGDWCAGSAVFGSALGLGTANPGYALSVAPYACYSPLGVCVGPGLDFAQVHGGVSGLLQGFTWRQNFFLVAQVLPKFWELLHLQAG